MLNAQWHESDWDGSWLQELEWTHRKATMAMFGGYKHGFLIWIAHFLAFCGFGVLIGGLAALQAVSVHDFTDIVGMQGRVTSV